MIALLAAAALVPVVQSALSIEDASGLRALLSAAGRHAPSLSPESVGQSLAGSVGVDLLAEPARWGLGRGPRMLAFQGRASGLSAPVANLRKAKLALDAWRRARPNRVGRIVGRRLYTASGREAAALLAALQKPRPLPSDLAGSASGPVWLYAALAEPLRGAVLRLDASVQGLVASGTVSGSAPVLAGRAPEGCEGTFVACLRAGLGPAGSGAFELALQQLRIPAQPGLKGASRVEERLESIDPRHLDALRPSASFDGPEGPGPALEGQIDLARIDHALSRLSPIDAVRSDAAAGAWAAHLLYGGLLRNAGPLGVTGEALPAGAAHVELRLPLR